MIVVAAAPRPVLGICPEERGVNHETRAEAWAAVATTMGEFASEDGQIVIPNKTIVAGAAAPACARAQLEQDDPELGTRGGARIAIGTRQRDESTMNASKTRHQAIAVIDFGGQYAHLIATKVRRQKVLAEIRQPDDPPELLASYRGIILSGSPSFSSLEQDSQHTKTILGLDLPVLGFCFGHQEIAKHYGGKVIQGAAEWGRAELHIVGDHPLFAGLDPVEQVWMSHHDSVVSLGPDFEELGSTRLSGTAEAHRFAAIGSDKHRRYGFQFHPEVDDTTHGGQMLSNFVTGICGCEPTWTIEHYLDEQLDRIRDQVGDGSVFLLVSGGVEYTVAAKMFERAIGAERLNMLHIDNGLMRHDESRRVLERFADLGLGEKLHFVDATDDFLGALGNETEPEKKRRIIGTTFIEVFEREARRLGIEDHLLGQGTIYPDTVETGGTKRADVIKTHHNRVPIIEQMIEQGRVIEPLAELYKVEVRELGHKLKIPRELIDRHPFPGPGLGVRLLCSSAEQSDAGPDAACVASIASDAGLAAHVLPVRSVGVKGDLRSYEHPIWITADASWKDIQALSDLLLRKAKGINRCVWGLAPAAPSSFEALAATMTKPRLDLLRRADHAMMEGLRRHGLYDRIWQCPTVLVPLRIDGAGEELCVLRPVHSERAMTASAAELPEALLNELRARIMSLPGISGLAIDLTSKPPGTIEWE